MAKSPLPASLDKLLRLATDSGTVDVDPDQDPKGYTRLVIDSANRRTRLDQRDADAANAARGPLGARAAILGQFSRMQANSARDGFASPWQPFFESLEVVGDNAGKPVKTDTKSLTGIPMAASSEAPRPGLPPGYTDDRYGRELDTFAAGGQAPAFAASDTRGFPDIGRRFQKEMADRLGLDTPREPAQGSAHAFAPIAPLPLPASMRALAKQGG